ncbi:MAG: hypothetical protein ACKOUR_08875, partial [Planctomycetota bacterium]
MNRSRPTRSPAGVPQHQVRVWGAAFVRRQQSLRRQLFGLLPAFVAGAIGWTTLWGSPAYAQTACPPCTAQQAYRIVHKTVYDQQPVTVYRLQYETVYDERQVVTRKPVWQEETQEHRYRVAKPVVETAEREERFTVRKPVWETEYREESYD